MTELKYFGQDMVDQDSFFRRIPGCLDRRQQIQLESLTFSADMITESWNDMRHIALQIGNDANQVSNLLRTRIFSSIWTIIGQIDFCRQIMEKLLADEDPDRSNILSLLGPARTLRNGFQHVDQNAQNIANSKSITDPLFGTLSYFLIDQSGRKGTIVILQTGLFRNNHRMVSPTMSDCLVGPVDLFTISAFGTRYEIGPPLAALRRVLATKSKEIEEKFRAIVSAELEAGRGTSIDDYLQPAESGYTFMIDCDRGGLKN